MEVFIYFCKLMYVIEIRLNMAIASMHVHVLPSIMSTLNLKYFSVYTQIFTNIDVIQILFQNQ